MKTSKRLAMFAICLLAIGTVFSGCKKDPDESSSGESGSLAVRMTDAPGDYLHVYVDVRAVEVHVLDSNQEEGWIALATHDSIYDLLTLQNDVTAVLVDGERIPAGKISQLRLILGPENRVVLKDGSVFSLKIPSSENTGIKININSEIQPNRTTLIVIDYDADRSVHVLGNGNYQMKPVIKVKSVTYL